VLNVECDDDIVNKCSGGWVTVTNKMCESVMKLPISNKREKERGREI